MTLDGLRLTAVLPSPRWKREVALRLLKLLGFYSLLSIGGTLLLLLAQVAIAWLTAISTATLVVGLILAGVGALVLYLLPRARARTLERYALAYRVLPSRIIQRLPATSLSEPQKEFLKFIQDYLREHGIAPTHREMRHRLGLSSYAVQVNLKFLEEKGFLRRDWNQKRGIELIRGLPGGERSAGDLPFLGRIAAGRPIEALYGTDRVAVPEHLLNDSGGDHYVLRVVGESMIDEGIHDGDFVIVLRSDVAEPGDMVVVLIGDVITLKFFFPEGNMVRLQPSNSTMQSILVPAQHVRVNGVVVGLMRKY